MGCCGRSAAQPGPPGPSAYDEAVVGGYTGTLEEFQAALASSASSQRRPGVFSDRLQPFQGFWPASDGVLEGTLMAPGGANYVSATATARTAASILAEDRIAFNGIAGDVFDQGGYGMTLDPTRLGIQAKPWDKEFIVDDDYVAFGTYHAAAYPEDFRVWVDDQEVPTWRFNGGDVPMPLNLDGADVFFFLNFSFTSKRTRRIRISGMVYFNSVYTNAHGQIYKPRAAPAHTGAVVSDSWYEFGAGTTDVGSTRLKSRTGWTWYNMAVGGTGFWSGSQLATPAHYGSATRLAALEAHGPTDLLVVNGSVNDIGRPVSEIIDRMGTYYDDVRERLGNQPIFQVGLEDSPYFRAQNPGIDFEDREAELMDFAETHPLVIGTLRPCAINLITGTGHVGALVGDGNADWKVGTDAVHLSRIGHYDNADRVVDAVVALPTFA